jgi:large subunit ribosomal protein L24
VQTTLLGIGIAIIVALVAALVGPLYIDWGRYRAEFEASATRLTGLDFRVAGSIDARLLPTPTLVLHDIAFGRPDETSKVRARALRIEFALGALVRGEWRVSDARLEGPQFAASLDRSGQLAWPLPKPGFDLGGISIERLTIEDGGAVLADAASDTRLTVEKLEFKGELRSLAGPVKGEGSFIVAGQHYPYRLATSRISDDGNIRVRLSVDPIDRRMTLEADASIWIDRGVPRFDGNIQLARPVGRAPGSAPSLATKPWRVTGHIKGDSATAVLEQIEFQYGPDDRALKLKGTANLAFGARPQINGVFSSTHIDLDRMLALPEGTHQRPLQAVKTAAESLLGMRLPLPVTASIAVDAVTLAGATLQRVGADVAADGEALDIRDLELRAPGSTQVRLSGRLAPGSAGASFAGSAKVDANEPRALVAWLSDRTDAQAIAAGPLRLGGDVTIGNERIEVDRLKVEFERMSAAGRVAYAWPGENRAARLDATLTSPDLDLDRIHGLAKAMFGSGVFEWPREGTLSLKADRAIIAGVESKDTAVQARIDASGIGIDRFAVADFGGAALTVKGRIGNTVQSPRGALSIELDGRGLDGVLAVLDKAAPRLADQLRRSAGRLTPTSVRASVALDSTRPDSTDIGAKLKLEGRAGALRITLQGDAVAAGDAFKSDILGALAAASVNVSGRVEADDGGLLLELIAADRFIAAEKRPARLLLTAKGALDGDLAVDAQIAGALNASGNGTMRVLGQGSPTAKLNVKVANANIRSLRRAAPGRPTELLPVSLNARLALTGDSLQLTELGGTVAGTRVAGRISIGIAKPFAVDGDIDLSSADLPAAIAVALGLPGSTAAPGTSSPGLWPAEPFDAEFGPLTGQIAIKSARVTLTPKLAARDVRGVLRFAESELAFQASDGTIAGGRVAADLTFQRRAEGVSARGRINVTGANAAEILPGNGSLSGRLTFDVSAEGSGMSPVALIGSLGGSGTFMLENGRLAGLDPAAFDTVIRAVDQGLPIDGNRVRDRADLALARGGLPIALAEGAIVIDAGQARLSKSTVRAQGADVAINGSINLAEAGLDAQLALSGTTALAAAASTRPQIAVAFKGSIEAPRRAVDVSAFASWLALRAVEQQSKKLEVLEGRASASPPAPGVAAPDAAGAPNSAAAVRSDPEAARPASPGRTQAAKPKPSATEQVPPLPPPVDIRPAPTPRAPRAHPTAPPPGTATQQQRPAPPPPARARSLSEILFGN